MEFILKLPNVIPPMYFYHPEACKKLADFKHQRAAFLS
jgi:hypothetical protein